jgi:cysteine synthase A
VIAGDGGERYPDTYYNDQWLTAQGLDLEPYRRTLEHLQATGVWLPSH